MINIRRSQNEQVHFAFLRSLYHIVIEAAGIHRDICDAFDYKMPNIVFFQWYPPFFKNGKVTALPHLQTPSLLLFFTG